MDAGSNGATPGVPRWLEIAGGVAWRALAVGGAVVAVVLFLDRLRVVVLPIFIALLVTSLLLPPARWLRTRGLGDAASTAVVMVVAVLLLAGIIAAVAPSVGGQVDDLGNGLRAGTQEAASVLADPPFNLQQRGIRERIDESVDRLRENSGAVSRGVLSGAVLLGEAITGFLLTVLLTFFFLKDGGGIWAWLVGLFAPGRRGAVDELGRRTFTALGGYVHGIAAVGFVDAVLIGILLAVLGVPLVLPLMILTFFAAFFPLIGAFTAGLAAALIALVFEGPVAALVVVGGIIVIQQVEGHLLYPIIMRRTVQLHPVAILLALGIGGVLAGIVGAFIAVPVASVISVAIAYAHGGGAPAPPPTAEGAATT
jgi:putative heme transporter